jgi:hypothetical protein
MRSTPAHDAVMYIRWSVGITTRIPSLFDCRKVRVFDQNPVDESGCCHLQHGRFIAAQSPLPRLSASCTSHTSAGAWLIQCLGILRLDRETKLFFLWVDLIDEQSQQPDLLHLNSPVSYTSQHKHLAVGSVSTDELHEAHHISPGSASVCHGQACRCRYCTSRLTACG